MVDRMKKSIAEDFVEDNGPLTPEQMAEIWDNKQYTPIDADTWRENMEASEGLREDDSGRFHLTDG